jgi:hypothetical protein
LTSIVLLVKELTGGSILSLYQELVKIFVLGFSVAKADQHNINMADNRQVNDEIELIDASVR